MSEHRRLLRSTSTISTLTIVSRIFGYIRDSRIAFLLGTGHLADAYMIAYRIPNLLRRLVGEGGVSAAFIPVFTHYLGEDRRREAWEFANILLTVLTVCLTAATIAGIVFAPYLVPLLAHGFDSTLGKLETTTVLTRIMFPYIALMGLSALAMGVLNSLGRFAASAFAPVLVNLSIISFSFLARFFSSPAIALAVGVVVGGTLQLAVQVPSLVRNGWRFRWIWNLAHPGVRRVAKLMAPLLFGIGIVQVDNLVGVQFASYMVRGSVMSLSLADRVMELVLGGFSIALATAILPLMSRQAAERRYSEMRTTLNFSIRMVLFITLPATVGLILLRTPIIQVLFEHGSFSADSTELTSWALLFFALGLSGFSMVKIVVPAFYALQDTRTPVWIALGSLILNVGLNFLFFRWLANGGPALATSLSAFFDAIVLTILFRRRHGSLGMRAVGRSCVKFAIAAAVMGMVAWVAIRLPGFYAGHLIQRVFALAATILAAVGAYFGTAYILRTEELGEVWGIYTSRATHE